MLEQTVAVEKEELAVRVPRPILASEANELLKDAPTPTEPRVVSVIPDGPTRLDLVVEVDCAGLAADTVQTIKPRDTLEGMLADQLAAAHSLSMALAAKAQHFANLVNSWDPKCRQQMQSIEAARMASAAARMMDIFQRGLLTLDRVRNGGRQTVVVQHVQVKEGGQAVVAGMVKSRARRRGGGRKK